MVFFLTWFVWYVLCCETVRLTFSRSKMGVRLALHSGHPLPSMNILGMVQTHSHLTSAYVKEVWISTSGIIPNLTWEQLFLCILLYHHEP
jgi:hypothetical protein